jgi:hypothetical protein
VALIVASAKLVEVRMVEVEGGKVFGLITFGWRSALTPDFAEHRDNGVGIVNKHRRPF